MRRILLIEDSEDDADLTIRALRRGGFELNYQRVQTGEAVTAALDAGGWDLVIADYSMPHFSGLDALKLTRERELDLPFILLSGTVGEELAVLAMKSGANDYVLKNDLTRLPLAAEREIRDAEIRQERKRAMASYRNLFDQVPVGIYSVTRMGTILDANPAFVALHGFATLDQMRQVNMMDFWVDKTALARMRALLERDRVVHNFETQLRKPDGSTFWCSLSGSMTSEGVGRESHHEGVAVDTTERRGVIDEMQRARDLAIEAATVRSEFLARMSHEIRTPLNAIIGTAELLSLSRVTMEQKRRTEIIQSSGKLLLTIVDDILDFSKLSAGKVVLEKIAFAPVELVEGLVDSFEAAARGKGIEIATQLDFNLPTAVIGDPNRLRQILNNLISNALKFTRAGDVLVRGARAEETATEVTLRFEVSDSGIGISPEIGARLFHPFIQGDGSTSRLYGGTGLGLVIAAQLTRQMGGDIGFESAGKIGTRFYFTARFGKSDQHPSAWMHPTALPAFHDTQFLIASGSTMVGGVTSEYLSAWGIANRTALSLAECLEDIGAADPGDGKQLIVILDDQLLVAANALNAAKAIKLGRRLSTRIVMLSSEGNADQSNPEVDEWLAKPLQPSRLFACLRQDFRRKRAPTRGFDRRDRIANARSRIRCERQSRARAGGRGRCNQSDADRGPALGPRLFGPSLPEDALPRSRCPISWSLRRGADGLWDAQNGRLSGNDGTAQARGHPSSYHGRSSHRARQPKAIASDASGPGWTII